MNPDVCAAIAQVAPVFMVLLVAERVVFTAEDSSEPGTRMNAAAMALGRVLVDLALALLGAALTMSSFIGIEEGGLFGDRAETMWILTFLLITAVLARWLLLSTPLSLIFEWTARGLTEFLNLSGEALARVLTGFPLAVSRVIFDLAEGLAQFVLGVASIGTLGRSTNRLTARRRRRHRGPRH